MKQNDFYYYYYNYLFESAYKTKSATQQCNQMNEIEGKIVKKPTFY